MATPDNVPLTSAVPSKDCPHIFLAVWSLVADATLSEVKANVPLADGSVTTLLLLPLA